MAIVSIGGQDFETYVDSANADIYFIPGLSEAAVSFKALADADAKNSHLVSATRYLDSLPWKTGYQTFAEREAEQKILDACCEIAAAMSVDPEFGTTVAAEARRLKAGSVEIENYRRTSASKSASGTPISFLPPHVRTMLAAFLGSFSMVATSRAFGYDRCSSIEEYGRELD